MTRNVLLLKKYFTILFIPLLLVCSADTLHAKDYDKVYEEEASLKKDTEFSGTVLIKETLYVPKGVTLSIAPGTKVVFGYPGICDDGNVNFSIEVEGSIVASGTKEEPIIFTSIPVKKRMKKSSFGEIYIVESEFSLFENVKFQYSHWGLHIHDSKVTVRHCEFKDVFGGIRFKGDVIIDNNDFINSDVALRFWMGSPEIKNNRFSKVGTAIFMREKVVSPVIRDNVFSSATDYFIKLGELQSEDITVTGSDFGTSAMDMIQEKIFDHGDEDYLGKVIIK